MLDWSGLNFSRTREQKMGGTNMETEFKTYSP